MYKLFDPCLTQLIFIYKKLICYKLQEEKLSHLRGEIIKFKFVQFSSPNILIFTHNILLCLDEGCWMVWRGKEEENHKPRGIFVLPIVLDKIWRYRSQLVFYMYLDIRMKIASTQHVLLLLASQYCCVVVLSVTDISVF